MASEADINKLLEPHLFQVIGSTPASIRDSVKKIDLKDKPVHGAYVMTVAIFAAAVNKATLETFLSKPEFGNIRQMVATALSIQGRTNMTAFTLLGHCLMTSEFANNITFVKEFRKKMGQDHLWEGNLESGSLSDKQKGILKEKKRVTEFAQAKQLGAGYVKWVGLDTKSFTASEAEFWGVSVPRQGTAYMSGPERAETVFPGAATASSSRIPTGSPPRNDRPRAGSTALIPFTASDKKVYNVPEDVMHYRMVILGHKESDIDESLLRNGLERFVTTTRKLAATDPDGSKGRAASTVG